MANRSGISSQPHAAERMAQGKPGVQQLQLGLLQERKNLQRLVKNKHSEKAANC